MTSTIESCCKNLTEIQRHDLSTFLLEKCNDGHLQRGTVNEAAAKWGLHRTTVTRIWKIAKASQYSGSLNVKSKRYGNTNKKRVLPNLEYIKSLKFDERSTMERISKKCKVAVGTVHKWVVEGLLKPHSSPLHPLLTDVNKINRVKFCLDSLEVEQTVSQQGEGEARAKIKFKDMINIIHIDEKWFYLSRDNQKYYVVDGEEVPHRTCKSKRYIIKVMFMCAVSRPICSDDGELLFDGKIGIFPYTCEEPARRSSKNRAAGTIETKAIDSVNKEVTKKCIIEKILPAIKAKWPATASKNIFIQQDNARPHFTNDDPDFRKAATEDGFNIELVFQPPNSPDLNTNDLGFFRAIQSLQSEISASNVQQLVGAVEKAYADYCPTKLNKIFLTLQSVMVEILKAKGHNNFSIPHMGKNRLQLQGLLPTNLEVNENIVKECIELLIATGQTSGLEKLITDLGYNLNV